MTIKSALATAWDAVGKWNLSHKTKIRDNIAKTAEGALKEKKIPVALDNALALMLHWDRHEEIIIPVVKKVFKAALDGGVAEHLQRAHETAMALLACKDPASTAGQLMIEQLQNLSLQAEEKADYERAGKLSLDAAVYIDAAARSRARTAGTKPEFGAAEQGSIRRFLTMSAGAQERNDLGDAVKLLSWAAEGAARASYGGEAARALKDEAVGRLQSFADHPPASWTEDDTGFIREIVALYTPSAQPLICPYGHSAAPG